MHVRLTEYVQRLLTQEQAFLAAIDVPLLVWESAAVPPEERVTLLTAVSNEAAPLRPGEPAAFEIRKGEHKGNAFAMGITVGRVPTNDITIPDESISRFHAYLQQNARTHDWTLVDASSTNGTFVNGERLVPEKPFSIVDKDKLRFGTIDLTFYLPQTFVALLRRTANSS